MALTTRVWGAGKLLVLLAALSPPICCSPFVAVRVADARARGARCPTSPGRSVNDASATARRSRPDAAGRREPPRRTRRCRPAAILQQDPPPGRASAASGRSRSGSAQGDASTSCPRSSARPSAARAVRLQQDGLDAGRDGRDPHRTTTPPDAVVAQDPAPGTHGAIGRAAREPRRARRRLRHAGPHRRRRRARRRLAARRAASASRSSAPALSRRRRRASCSARRPQAGSRSRPGEAISLEVSR